MGVLPGVLEQPRPLQNGGEGLGDGVWCVALLCAVWEHMSLARRWAGREVAISPRSWAEGAAEVPLGLTCV